NRALPTDLSYNTDTTWLLPGLPDLTKAAGYIPHTLSQTAMAITLDNQTIHGFRSSKLSPGMSIRDLAWGMETAQYYYGDEYLRQAIEQYLQTQPSRVNQPQYGAVEGILTATDDPGKPVRFGDEEISLIHAAYLYYNLTFNADWLQQDLNGLPVIDRLNLAAEWLYRNRFDPETELLWRDQVLAWQHPGLETVPDGLPLISIYDQALAYLALIELAKMNAAVQQISRADAWQQRAEALKLRVNSHLWQPDPGLFRPPHPLTGPATEPDTGTIVAVENALAVYSGLTNFAQNRSIIDGLERARMEAGASKPGLTLHPAPVDSTSHQPGTGAVWDWWGGIQIEAEFVNGFSKIGQTHLLQVANEWQDHPGNIIEWQSPTDATKQGSHYHHAAAGTMGSAIIKGFFGVELTGSGLTLSPRLGLNDGFIRVYQAATDRYAAYSYDWNQGVTRLAYGTNAEIVQFNVLTLQTEQISQVRLDDRPVPFSITTVGHDSYVTFSGPRGEHTIELVKGSNNPQAIETASLSTNPSSDGAGESPAGSPNFGPNVTRPQAPSSLPESDRQSAGGQSEASAAAGQNLRALWRDM
ncbi:MAG: hypothetical protein R3264_21325, partial [Anaerolineae bacterium]|nr:hypothetical protein [Anaerolineae bacterium]